jgi:predicted permease
MNWLPKLKSRLRALFRKRELDAEMDEEIRSHIEMRTLANIEAGINPEEARLTALRQFGWAESIKETCREQRGVSWIEHLVRDARFGIRRLWKNPAFTFVAVLTLALGIGGSTAVFSLINGVILRPLPYPDPERLVMVWTESSASRTVPSAYANYVDWKKQCSAFENLAIYDPIRCLLTVSDRTEGGRGARVSASFFSVLGVAPFLGREFSAEEEKQRARVAILGYRLWQDRFAGVSNVVGRTLEIDGQRSEIIGVMPESFGFPGGDTEFWELNYYDQTTTRGIGMWMVLGRLKQGQSITQAETELRSVAARLASEYSSENRGLGARIVPLSEAIAGPNLRVAFWILFGGVIFVLLIGCSNLVNLLLARGVTRQRELATRLALGASPMSIVRQLAVECVPLGALGGLAGVALALLIVRAVRAFAVNRIPRLGDVQLDLVVVCFAVGLTALATLIFAVIPAMQARRLDINESLKEGARGTTGSRQTFLRHALIISEVALAFLLLVGAGLLFRSFQLVRTLDTGFDPERVLSAGIRVPVTANRTNSALIYQDLSRRLEALPGIESVGLIEDVFGGGNSGGRITLEGAALDSAAEVTPIRLDSMTPSWFQAVGAPLLRGRFFDEHDRAGTLRVAIINETMARRFWPGQDALGKRFKLGRADSTAPWLTVVGVVRDMRRERSLERPPLPQIFRPVAQLPSLHMDLLVRTSSDPMALAESVRRQIEAVDKGIIVSGVSTLEKRIGASLFERRFQTSLLSAFSLVALLLAGIGTYGVVHYSVQQRVREIGIRMAMGARKLDVFSLVVGRGMRMVLIGVGLGIGLALGITRLMERLLFGVKPMDPLTFAAVSLLLLGIALLACWLPARRAMHLDPIHALREQ